MAEERTKVAPAMCSYVDRGHTKLTVECVLPGVSQENITLNMLEDSLDLSAPKEDIEYVTTLSFGWPVKPEEAEATYQDGLLKIEVPFKEPMRDPIKVPVKAK